jgi:ribonuclease G
LAKTLLINKSPFLCRVALLEEQVAQELYVEPTGERSLVGNIYRARVKKVVPGINAAFLDLGQKLDGFMYGGDIRTSETLHLSPSKRRAEELLKEDMSLIVQVIKDPMKAKGPRVSTQLTFAGRYLVYVIGSPPESALSSRITDEAEAKRLKEIIDTIRTESETVIIRTAAENATREDLESDLAYLRTHHDALNKRGEEGRKTECLYEDLDLPLRAVRDLFDDDVTEIVVDDSSTYQRITEWTQRFMPQARLKLKMHPPGQVLFEQYGVELAINEAMDSRVWLPGGGHVVIEETEALTTVDVNSGTFVGKSDSENSILQVNLEAARAIAHQLRLRDIGGIIVIDFIDVKRPSNRKKITHTLIQEFAKSKARSRVLPMSDIGLTQITRERSGDSLARKLTTPCHYCKGKGMIHSAWSLSIRILSKVETMLHDERFSGVQVVGHAEVLSELREHFKDALAVLEKRFSKKIVLYPREDYHFEKFDIVPERVNEPR